MKAIIANSWIYRHAMRAHRCRLAELPAYSGSCGSVDADIRAQFSRMRLDLGPAPWWTFPLWLAPIGMQKHKHYPR